MSYSAILRLTGVDFIQLERGWLEDDNLVRVEIDGRPLVSVSAPAEVSNFAGGDIGLIFASGSEIKASFQCLSLELTSSEFLESWDGPLVHDHPRSDS